VGGRSSTADQFAGLAAQVVALKAAGCRKIFQEQVSSVAHRDELEAALEFIREGDKLVVIKLTGWLDPSPIILGLEERLWAKGAATRVLASISTTAAP
jgi:Resolvase, N terminal domain